MLHAIFTKEVPFLYPNDFYKVKLHQDKATSTLKSNTAFLENMKIDTIIESISFQHIFAMSPEVLPIDYCGFSVLKKTLSTNSSQLKANKKEWKSMSLEIYEKLFYQGNYDVDL